MGCGCGGSAPQSGPAQQAPQQGMALEPGVAYTALAANGDHRVFSAGSTVDNQAAARLHAGASGGGHVRIATGTEALTGRAEPGVS